MKVYLKKVLEFMPDGTWVQVKCDGIDTIFFGRTGWGGTDELLNLVKKRFSPNPEVYEMTHLDGFDKGLLVKCR